MEYFCSSDPESLDGVAIPEKGAALMDGTAPHVYDPVLPRCEGYPRLFHWAILDERPSAAPGRNCRRPSVTLPPGSPALVLPLSGRGGAGAEAACAGEEKPAAMRALLKDWTDVLPLRAAKAAAASCSARPSPRRDWFAAQSFPPKETRRFDLLLPLGCHHLPG